MKQLNKHQVVGWIAVSLSIVITCVWAFWGILETFHEGWYYESWLSNVGLMFVQYLSPMIIFMGVTLISITWPRFGGGLRVIFALLAIWFFQAFSNAATFLLIIFRLSMCKTTVTVFVKLRGCHDDRMLQY